jgi:glutaredoxin-like protein NrdH
MQCNFTKKFLTEHNIEYTEINVEDDQEALAHVKELGFQAVPVVETETEIWYGFQPDKLAKL